MASVKTPATVKGRINQATGVSRRQNPQSRFYEREGYSGLSNRAATRGKSAVITPVTRG